METTASFNVRTELYVAVIAPATNSAFSKKWSLHSPVKTVEISFNR